MNKQEILDLIKEAKSLGLKSISIGDVKVEFNDEEIKKVDKTPVEDNELVAKPSPYDELTEEEILFWSTDYGRELETNKKQEFERSLKEKVEQNV